MQWTKKGAHLLLQTPTWVLDDLPEETFREVVPQLPADRTCTREKGRLSAHFFTLSASRVVANTRASIEQLPLALDDLTRSSNLAIRGPHTTVRSVSASARFPPRMANLGRLKDCLPLAAALW
jgi:hypothetical protein